MHPHKPSFTETMTTIFYNLIFFTPVYVGICSSLSRELKPEQRNWNALQAAIILYAVIAVIVVLCWWLSCYVGRCDLVGYVDGPSR